MEAKLNDKYKKRYILKQIQDKWGYYEYDGDIILIKNCILKNKYNKVYQLIFNGGEAIDGLYLINAFDINLHYEKPEKVIYTITNKKYDKIAGYDGFTIHSFDSKQEFIMWLLEENFLNEDDLKIVNASSITKSLLQDFPRFILDSE